MTAFRYVRDAALASLIIAASACSMAQTTQSGTTFEPTVGQAGKDVVWVPTPQALVDKMLDMAKVTPNDYVIDLGSGDGRTVITAAKRGARALGIEYNPDMVELSKRNAAKEGVTDKAKFVQADLFETDFSQATVITMFLLPEHQPQAAAEDPRPEARHARRLEQLRRWATGSADETADRSAAAAATLLVHRATCGSCPAKVEGTWKLPQGELDAQAGVPEGLGHADRGRQDRAAAGREAPRQRDLVPRRRRRLQGHGQRQAHRRHVGERRVERDAGRLAGAWQNQARLDWPVVAVLCSLARGAAVRPVLPHQAGAHRRAVRARRRLGFHRALHGAAPDRDRSASR